MTLRSRILLGMGAVVALLLVAGLGILRAQSATLVGQADQRLESLRGPALLAAAATPADSTAVRGRRALDGLYVGRLSPNGALTTTLALDGDPSSMPILSTAPRLDQPVTVATTDGGRMRVVGFSSARGTTAILGAPLAEVDRSIAVLARNLLIVGGLLLAVIALVTWWVLRLGVGPITDVAAAARDVRAGDHTRRVPTFPAGTEAQELGEAFNLLVDENLAAQARLRQFVADASHELRTPLTTLVGYASLQAAGGLADADAAADAIRRMGQEAQRMSGLVDDLLLLAESDRGPALRREAVDLVPLVEGLVADARVLDPARTIGARLPEAAVVTGDHDRLTQVVGILLDNARKHTPPGSPIELAIDSSGGGWLLAVTDHGPGLAPAEAERVFDRFYRSDSARARATGGTGLGLAIASAIVAAHGGRIGVESVPGAGSRFWVELTGRPAADLSP